MSEKTDWRLFRDKIKFKMDRVDRIENGVGVGMPDINFCGNGVESWIEMKSPKEPKREDTPLFGSNHRLSQDQKNWFKRQIDAGGRAWILIGTDKRWLLIHGKYADELNLMDVGMLILRADWHVLRPVKDPMAWANLRTVLVRP